MRWLLLPLLWVLAIGLALIVLWRMWRGRPAVLRGRWGPRVIRMAAVVLVVLGAGAEKVPAAALPVDREGRDDRLAERISDSAWAAWLYRQMRPEQWHLFKQGYEKLRLTSGGADPAVVTSVRLNVQTLPVAFRELVTADVTAMVKGKPAPEVTAEALLAALDRMEQEGYFDHWGNAYLWRKAAANRDGWGREATVTLFARLARHARVTDALIRAYALVKPVGLSPRAWMSKAGPSPRQRIEVEREKTAFWAAARAFYEDGGLGTWETDGVVQVRVTDGKAATLHRESGPTTLELGKAILFGRLDLLQTSDAGEAVIEHAEMGRITLPADRVISAWELPDYLPEEARKKLELLVDEALDGGEDPAESLEKMLPLAHEAIRVGLRERPKADGAPRLRLILALFDDAVMPTPETATVPGRGPVPEGRGGRR